MIENTNSSRAVQVLGVLFLVVMLGVSFFLGTQYQLLHAPESKMNSGTSSKVAVPVPNSSDDCPWSPQRHLVTLSEDYTNPTLGFSMTSFGRGWYLPTATDTDPHFYTCSSTGRDADGFEIQKSDYDSTLADIASSSAKVDTSVVRGANVYNLFEIYPPQGETWPHGYIIVYPNSKKAFTFFSREEIDRYGLSDTFKPI